MITRDSANPCFEKGTVAYEGRKIAEVGHEKDLKSKYPNAGLMDAKGGVIMPAFINAHAHIPVNN